MFCVLGNSVDGSEITIYDSVNLTYFVLNKVELEKMYYENPDSFHGVIDWESHGFMIEGVSRIMIKRNALLSDIGDSPILMRSNDMYSLLLGRQLIMNINDKFSYLLIDYDDFGFQELYYATKEEIRSPISMLDYISSENVILLPLKNGVLIYDYTENRAYEKKLSDEHWVSYKNFGFLRKVALLESCTFMG